MVLKQLHIAALGILLLAIISLPGWSDETDWSNFDEPYIPPAHLVKEMYSPYPAQAQPQPVQPQKTGFWGKLLRPLTKRMSPPINQVPKISAGPPKETKPLPDPLVRLAKGVEYEGKHADPGVYLLQLRMAQDPQNAQLALIRQSQTVLTAPIQPEDTTTQTSTLPEPPTAGADQTKSKQGSVEPKAHVELAQSGQTIRLVYQQGDKQYTSVPLSVSESWQP